MTLNATRTFVIDLAERAGKTFLQAAAATFTIELAGSGASVANLPTLAVAEKIGLACVVAGLAAVASMLSSVLSGLKTQTASASATVAESAPASTGSHAADAPAAAPVLPVPDGQVHVSADPAATGG